ncbi:TlpA family protein disulfide reductase [Methylomonas sp. LL1]|uniref:TlpA family protein disulfide reductase n=1 Tax=Methylomonas sp. LL1 TaxID=2785785 RepID=UPI0018C35BD1|nr:TlpA disulfide reductase family protein [Methylomonas sp. LL1]QPK63972.1 TlpA family protein disulfide reductase [Methylomonas sp. LL1]
MNKYLALAFFLLLYGTSSFAVEENQPVPNCSASMADSSDTLNFDNYKGKVILVDFWATWCPPCKKSMPFLNALRNQHLKEGFEIVAINVDENSEDARQFLQSYPVDYKIAFDASGNCPGVFDVKAMPSSYLIDRTGKVRLIHLGYRDEDQSAISERVTALLAE